LSVIGGVSTRSRRCVIALAVTSLAVLPVVTDISRPTALAAADSQARSYVIDRNNNSVAVVATSTGQVTSTITGLPSTPIAGATSPDGRRLYVVDRAANQVTAIDTATNTIIGNAATGAGPIDVAITPDEDTDGGRTYVANNTANSLTVLRTRTGAVITTISSACGPSAPASTLPISIGILGDGSVMFVGCKTPAGTGVLTARVPPDGGFLYSKTMSAAPTVMAAGLGFSAAMCIGEHFPNGTGGIAVYSASSQSFPQSVAYSTPVDGIAITPSGDRLLATTSSANVLRLLDLGLATKDSVGVPGGFHSVAVTPDGKTALVTNRNSGSMSMIDIASDAFTLRHTVTGLSGPSLAVPEPAVPTAAFTVSDAVPGHPTVFDASASADTQGRIASYHWDFGDGTTTTVTTPTTTHTYQYGGHTATLTVTDDAGFADTSSYGGRSIIGGSQAATLTKPVPFANPQHDVLYVPSYGGLHVVDPFELRALGTIALDGQPGWVAVAPNGRWVVKTKTGSNDDLVTIVDPTTNFVVKTLALPGPGDADPEGVVFAPGSTTAYVLDAGRQRIDLVAVPSGAVTSHINLNITPYAVAYASPLSLSGAGLLAVVGHDAQDTPTLAVVSLSLKTTIRTITLHAAPQDIAIAGGATTAFVSTDGATVEAVDIITGLIRDVDLKGASFGVALLPNGSQVFATEQRANALARFGPSASSVAGETSTGFNPFGVTATTNGSLVAVANNGENSVTVIAAATHTVVGTIDLDPVGSDDPTHVAVAPPVQAPPPAVPPGSPPPGSRPPGTTPGARSPLPVTGGHLTAAGLLALVMLGAATVSTRFARRKA
jgi:YVTN family beta-propeller protein